MTRCVIGYDGNGHKLWSENSPHGNAKAPLITNVLRTKIAGYVSGSHLKDMESGTINNLKRYGHW